MFALFGSFYSKFKNSKDTILVYPGPKRIKKRKYDKIFLPDFIGKYEDYQPEFRSLRKLISNQGALVITSINPIWGKLFGYKNPKTPLLYLWFIENLLEISNFKIIKSGYFVIPPKIPILSGILNLLIPKIPKLKRLLPYQYVIAKPEKILPTKKYSASVVIPVHNEEGNVADCIKQVPKMGKFTEIIIVDDGSTDNTLKIAKSFQKRFKNLKIFSHKPHWGKVWAVKRGFDEARGDILMIWDADRTVLASELPRFYDLMASGQAEYVHGTRLAYPMEKQAMKVANLLGNLFFGWLYSFIMSTRITDTLCGTKVIFRKDYKKIKFGTEPWGDFDLLFGAKNLGLKINEIPVHYKARVADLSKMKAFRYGMVVAKMAAKGIFEFKVLPLIKKVLFTNPIILILLIASVVRFVGLVPNTPYHPDEAYTQQATQRLAENIVLKGDFDPKAYKYGSFIFFINSLTYLPFLIWTHIIYFLNNLLLNTSLAARPFMDTFLEISYNNGPLIFLFQRGITATFGIASVYLVYLIGKKLFNNNVGLLGALLFAVTPLHVRDSHYITTDVPFLFFVLLTVNLSINIFQKNTMKWYILTGFFAGATSTIRYYPIALLILPVSWILAFRRNYTYPLKIFACLFFIPLGLWVGVPFLPLSEQNHQIFKQEMADWVTPYYGTSISHFALDLFLYITSLGQSKLPDIHSLYTAKFIPYYSSYLLFTGFGILPTLAGLLGITFGIIRYPKQSIFLLLIPLVNFIYISSYIHAVYQRMAIPVLPFLSVFAGLFIFLIWKLLNRTLKIQLLRKTIFVLVLSFIFFYPFSQSFHLSYDCSKDSIYKQAADWMNIHINSDIKLAYQPGLHFPPKPFYNHQDSIYPNREFFLEEIRQIGKDHAFFNPDSLRDYYNSSYINDFFIPPADLYQNSQINIALFEYQTRAQLLNKIDKNKLCESTEFYFYKLPEILPESKNLYKDFSFDSNSELEEWKLDDYGVKTQQVKFLLNSDEGYNRKGSIEYRWTNIAYTSPRLISPRIQIQPGKNYTLSAWVKSQRPLQVNEKDGYLRLDFYTDKGQINLPGQTLAITPRIFGDSKWRNVKVTAKAPDNTNFAIISFQTVASKASNSFYIDEIQIFEN